MSPTRPSLTGTSAAGSVHGEMQSMQSTDGLSRRLILAAATAGLVLAAVYILSPLTIVAAIIGPWIVWTAARDLPQRERYWLYGIVAVAVSLRVAIVALLFLTAEHDSQAAAILVPDEAYTLSRTLRIRNLILGLPALKYDYLIADDEYGKTSYLWVVTAIQLLFGPSPYGLRLVNLVFFLAGALLLFRLARQSYGRLVAFGGIVVLLFQPTWIMWSVSLLKESLYFLLTALVLVATMLVARGRPWTMKLGALVIVGAAVYAVRDLRAGAMALILTGLVLGFLLRVLTVSTLRFVAGTIAIAALLIVLLLQPTVQARVMAGMQEAASMHIGHVFTIGHHYKLLDEGFYTRLNLEPALTPPEAARFALRAVASFLVVPLPWEVGTRGELVQLPEHLIWYLLVLLTPIGFLAGLRRDRLLTCLFIGYVLPTAAVVALTTGNVGTIVRFRGLVTPYLVWVGSLAVCVIMQQLISAARKAEAGSSALREAREHV